MRKIFVLAFLGAVIAVASLFPLRKSDAQKAQRQDVGIRPIQASSRALPDLTFDLATPGNSLISMCRPHPANNKR